MDRVALDYLKRPDIPDSAELRAMLAAALVGAGESLLLSPRVTFRVYGENVVLAQLTKMFNVRGVERLLEEDAVEFILWRALVGGVVNNPELSALGLIAHGNLENREHSDPEASCVRGLEGWCPDLPSHIRLALAKKAAAKMIVTPAEAPGQAVAAVHEAQRSGLLSELGIAPETTNFDPAAYSLMVGLIDALTEASVLLGHEWDLYEAKSTWDSMLRVAREVRSGSDVLGVTEAILRTEVIPAVDALLLKKELSFEDILDLRDRPQARAFREWLWTQPDPTAKDAVLGEYAALVAKGSKTRLDDKWWFKPARTLGVSLAGIAVASAVTSGVGAAAVGTGIALLDTLVESVREGRNPRRFASTLRDFLATKRVERAASNAVDSETRAPGRQGAVDNAGNDVSPAIDLGPKAGPTRQGLQASLSRRNLVPNPGRNDPCPCGSKKKFKKCCGRAADAAADRFGVRTNPRLLTLGYRVLDGLETVATMVTPSPTDLGLRMRQICAYYHAAKIWGATRAAMALLERGYAREAFPYERYVYEYFIAASYYERFPDEAERFVGSMPVLFKKMRDKWLSYDPAVLPAHPELDLIAADAKQRFPTLLQPKGKSGSSKSPVMKDWGPPETLAMSIGLHTHDLKNDPTPVEALRERYGMPATATLEEIADRFARERHFVVSENPSQFIHGTVFALASMLEPGYSTRFRSFNMEFDEENKLLVGFLSLCIAVVYVIGHVNDVDVSATLDPLRAELAAFEKAYVDG